MVTVETALLPFRVQDLDAAATERVQDSICAGHVLNAIAEAGIPFSGDDSEEYVVMQFTALDLEPEEVRSLWSLSDGSGELLYSLLVAFEKGMISANDVHSLARCGETLDGRGLYGVDGLVWGEREALRDAIEA